MPRSTRSTGSVLSVESDAAEGCPALEGARSSAHHRGDLATDYQGHPDADRVKSVLDDLHWADTAPRLCWVVGVEDFPYHFACSARQ